MLLGRMLIVRGVWGFIDLEGRMKKARNDNANYHSIGSYKFVAVR